MDGWRVQRETSETEAKMAKDYLIIARSYVPNSQLTKGDREAEHATAAVEVALGNTIVSNTSELPEQQGLGNSGSPRSSGMVTGGNVTPSVSERSELCEISPLFRDLHEGAVARAYETKATLPGGKPPTQEVQEMQAWLATIDWNKGLRCGRTTRQCLTCTGLACHGTREW